MSQLLNIQQVADYLQVSTRTVWRRIEIGKFPKPIYITGYPRWDKEELLAYIKKTASSSDNSRHPE